MTDTGRWTPLAHLLRPQGRKGEVLAELLTDFPERFEERGNLILASPGFDGPPEDARPTRVISHWLPAGRNAGRVVLGLAGVDSISAAETLAGLDLLTPTVDRMVLEQDTSYIDDLIGCTVYQAGEPLGIITSVDFSTTPDGSRRLVDVAPLLTAVTTGGYEMIIPYVKAFLLEQDLPGRRIVMQLPEGLVDLNR